MLDGRPPSRSLEKGLYWRSLEESREPGLPDLELKKHSLEWEPTVEESASQEESGTLEESLGRRLEKSGRVESSGYQI